MPAKNPVIAVVIPREVNSIITRLAGLRSTSKSAVVREFLIETAPVLERVANLLDLAARADRTALKSWVRDMEFAQSDLETKALDAMATMETMQNALELTKPGRPPAGAGRTRKRVAAARRPATPGKRHV
jgi:hypothetical protein